MKIFKGTFIIVILIFIVIIAQIFRLNKHVTPVYIEHKIDNEYKLEQARSLSESEKNQFSNKVYLILSNLDTANEISNLISIFEYLKIDYRIEDYSNDIDYSLYESIILLEGQISDKELDIISLTNYVEEGGRLLYLGNGTKGDENLIQEYPEVFGVNKLNGFLRSNYIYFDTDVLLGIRGHLDMDDNDYEDYMNFEYLDVELVDNAIVHMEEISGSPLIWEYSVNKGKIMVVNTGRYESKEMRGLIAGSLGLLEDLLVYPIINSQVIFIDDFPADYNSNHLLIKENYGRDFERFIKEIWWPDMVDLMKEYDLKYTSAFIQTYNDVVDGPFAYNKSTIPTTIELASDLINSGGEVSFNGYNHQSLLFDQISSSKVGYKAWPSEKNIVESIKKSLNDFGELFPNYKFYTYVPPSNLLDKRAIPLLKEAIPSLKTISGLYYGEVDDFGRVNQDTFVQEIGVNEKYDFVDLPRITSDSFLHDNAYFRIASSITLHGLVNHFIHPDDILDPERSLNLLWDDLFKETTYYFKTLNTQYPWMDKDTASTASEKVKQVFYSKPYYEFVDSKIIIAIDNFYKEIDLILVTDKEIVSGSNCEFIKIGTNRYLVRIKNYKASLEVRE